MRSSQLIPISGRLFKCSVRFYEEKTEMAPMFRPVTTTPVDFDTDEEIDRDFKFDEIDEEYFDSDSHDPESEEDTEEQPDPDDVDLSGLI